MTATSKHGTALVLDAEKVICRECEGTLASLGYRVQLCDHCADALNAVVNARFDVVVVSLRGLEDEGDQGLIQEIRKGGHCTAIVVIAGHPTIRQAVDLLKAGADEILPEPFSSDELRLAVATSLRQRRELSA
jgi:NtrC-family two-component system response regulator AlgB